MAMTPGREQLPFSRVWFSRRGSSGLEDGLNNLGWETGATPTASTTLGGGEKWCPLPVRVYGEYSSRATRSANHGRPRQCRATKGRRTLSRRTLSRTPGSRAIGGKAYKRSLGHTCTMASSPSGAGWVRENQRGYCEVSWDINKSTWARPNFYQICSITSVWSIHFLILSPYLERMSAPWLRYPGIYSASGRAVSPGPTEGSGAPACTGGPERRPPVDDLRNHQCIVCVNEHVMVSQVWEKMLQCLKFCQHLQAVDVPAEMGTFPQTLGGAATHARSPAREGGVRRERFATTWSCQHGALWQEPRFLPHF